MPSDTQRVPDDAAAERLAGRLPLTVVRPSAIEYDHARRVWNSAIDRYPAAIVRCSTRDDVVQAVRVLREEGLDFTVRGGGHNPAGNSVRDGAVVVDLSGLRRMTFDDERQTVRVEGGCVWGEVDRATADLGRVVPAGMVSHTGVAGLTLGGGTGYLTRQLGTTSDNLLEAEVVLADGSVVRASHDSHPNLFWALRGAGHNFGAVTAFTFRLNVLEVPVLVRQSIFDASSRTKVLAFFRGWAPSQPRRLITYLNVLRIPPHWHWIPAEHRGESAINVTSVFYGDKEEGERVSEAIHAVAPAIWTSSRVMRHVELQHACDDDWRWGVKHYWKPSFLSGIPDDAIDKVVQWCDQAPATYEQARSLISPQPINQFEINYRGGALGDADPNGSAYSDRVSPYNMNIQAIWTHAEVESEIVAWACGFSEALAPYWSGAYTNFMSDAGTAREAERIFGPEKFAKLAAVKREYDPQNVFAGALDLASP